MRIYLYDGSKLDCTEIEFNMYGNALIADEYRTISLDEVVRITDD